MARKRVTVGAAQKYLAATANNNDVNVIDQPNAAATHVGAKVTYADLKNIGAFDLLRHEAGHVKMTDEMAMRLAQPQHRHLLNVLEDIRTDTAMLADAPGARILAQGNVVDPILPRLYAEENWVVQCMKAMYVVGMGFDYDESRLSARSRKVLAKFRAGGFVPRIVACADTLAVLDIVPEVADLFGNAPQPVQPPPQNTCEYPGPVNEDDNRPTPPRGDNPNPPPQDGDDEDGEPKGSGKQPKADADPDGEQPVNRDDRFGPKPDGGDDEGDDDDASPKRPPKVAKAGKSKSDAEDGEKPDAVVGQKWWEKYDADERRNKNDAARKFGEKSDDYSVARLVDEDENLQIVTGGPGANALDRDARGLQRAFQQWEREAKAAGHVEDGWENEVDFGLDAAGADENAPQNLNKDVAKFADIDAVVKDGVVDLTAAAKACGAVGYDGRAIRIDDARGLKANPKVMAAMTAKVAPLSEYMGRVIKTFLQTRAQRGWDNGHRTGRINLGRTAALIRGDLKVFRRREAANLSKPSVMLLIDNSSSMDAYNARNMAAGSVAYHASAASIMLGDALAKAGVPFEVAAFSSVMRPVKSYAQAWDKTARSAIVALASNTGGGTSAAEALAFGWVRANTRAENRRVVIMVTDGAVPQNTKDVVNGILRQPDATVIGVGIGGVNVRETFPESISVNDASDLPGEFAVLLRRLLNTGRI